MTRRLAITGVGGFIGLRLAERALSEGWSVAGLDRDRDGVARAAALGADVFEGDVVRAPDVRRLCADATAVVHTAAVVQEDGDWDLFRRVNVGGTSLVARLARAADARFVHLSSVMVYGFRYADQVTEAGPLRGDGNPYCQTKIESEDAAQNAHEDVVILRPGDVYGPGSIPWVVRPAKLLRRRMLVLPDGGRGIMNHLYIDNLIDAVMLALETPHVGEAFTITDGARTTFAEYFERLAAIVGTSPPRSLPAPVLRGVFGGVAGVRKLLRRPALPAPAAVDFVNRRHAYSIEKAQRVLGYAPRIDLPEGMARTAAWWTQQGRSR